MGNEDYIVASVQRDVHGVQQQFILEGSFRVAVSAGQDRGRMKKVKITERALEQLDALPEDVQAELFEFMQILATCEDPAKLGDELPEEEWPEELRVEGALGRTIELGLDE